MHIEQSFDKNYWQRLGCSIKKNLREIPIGILGE